MRSGAALGSGYRLIDTAAAYDNERQVGDAVRDVDLSRSEVFLETKAIAEAHGKSPAQVMLRWGLQERRSVIPKSTKPARIAENIDVFDFELTADEITAIDGLDTPARWP